MATAGQRIFVVENATGPVLRPGFMVDPFPPGRSDQLVVYFTLLGPVTMYSVESASDTVGTWRADPAAPEAITPASLDSRLDAVEAAVEVMPAQADIDLHTTALAEIRDKYPDHAHGLLGLGGDPLGSDGDLTYTLPGD